MGWRLLEKFPMGGTRLDDQFPSHLQANGSLPSRSMLENEFKHLLS